MSQLIKTEALVLHASRWRESSKIVHVFSEDYGYIGVLAKGALRPKSPFRGALETLNHVEIIFSHREGRELQTLTAVTQLNAFLHIRDDLPKTAGAFAAAELLKQLFRVHEPVTGFFRYVVDWLASLNDHADVHPLAYLWHFMLELSRVLGFGWEIGVCADSGALPQRFPVLLDYREGSIVCNASQKSALPGAQLLSQPAWQQLRDLAATPVAGLGEMAANARFVARPDLTATLVNHLEHHTDGRITLKSLNWYA